MKYGLYNGCNADPCLQLLSERQLVYDFLALLITAGKIQNKPETVISSNICIPNRKAIPSVSMHNNIPLLFWIWQYLEFDTDQS